MSARKPARAPQLGEPAAQVLKYAVVLVSFPDRGALRRGLSIVRAVAEEMALLGDDSVTAVLGIELQLEVDAVEQDDRVGTEWLHSLLHDAIASLRPAAEGVQS